MPITKFTAYVSGNNPDEVANQAEKAANEFFKDLPGAFHATGTEVSFDPESHQFALEQAIQIAEEKLAALPEDEREGAEFIPAPVPKYSGWVTFEYDSDQTQAKKSIAEVQADNKEADAEAPVRPENDPKYQDAF